MISGYAARLPPAPRACAVVWVGTQATAFFPESRSSLSSLDSGGERAAL
jgi:hypothetical protein